MSNKNADNPEALRIVQAATKGTMTQPKAIAALRSLGYNKTADQLEKIPDTKKEA